MMIGDMMMMMMTMMMISQNTTGPFSHTQHCNSKARHVQNRTKNMHFCNSDENHVHKLGGYDV